MHDCFQETLLSWKINIWVIIWKINIFSLFSYGAAPWFQVVLLWIAFLSVHLFAMRMLRKMGCKWITPGGSAAIQLLCFYGQVYVVSSPVCFHEVFSLYSDHWSCSAVLLVRWNCRFRKCFLGFTQFHQKSWKWVHLYKKQKFTKPHRKQSRQALELVPILWTCG